MRVRRPHTLDPTRSYCSLETRSFIFAYKNVCKLALLLCQHRSDVRATARFQPPPEHVDQRSAKPGRRRSDGARQRPDGRSGAAPATQPAGVAVAGHEPGDAEGARPELDAHTQGRAGPRGIPAVPVQRGLPLRALRLPGTPDAFPLHAPRLRLQFLRQDPVRAAHGQAREVRLTKCHV